MTTGASTSGSESLWVVPVAPDGWSEWVHPLPGYRIQCCDCGLIHKMEFSIVPLNQDVPLNDGEDEAHVIVFRARRDNDTHRQAETVKHGSVHGQRGPKASPNPYRDT